MAELVQRAVMTNWVPMPLDAVGSGSVGRAPYARLSPSVGSGKATLTPCNPALQAADFARTQMRPNLPRFPLSPETPFCASPSLRYSRHRRLPVVADD